MRPCQQCNGPVGNADKVCPACGAEQLATVGFQKAAPHFDADEIDIARDEEDSRDMIQKLEDIDFDPLVAISAGGLALVAITFLVAAANPLAGGVLLVVTGLAAVVLQVGIFGGG